MIQKFKLLFVHESTHLCLIENCDTNASESSGGLGALATKIMSYNSQRQEKNALKARFLHGSIRPNV